MRPNSAAPSRTVGAALPVTEYIEPDDVDELLEVEGFHHRDRGLLLSALAAPLPTFGEEVHPGPHQKRPC
jgi:death-on-curing protein